MKIFKKSSILMLGLVFIFSFLWVPCKQALALPAIPPPKLNYYSGPGTWNTQNTKLTTSGDYNNDGLDEMAAFYDYGNNNMAIWAFDSVTPPVPLEPLNQKAVMFYSHRPVLKFISGPGLWSVASTKHVASVDYNGDGNDDIAVMYDYGNSNMGIWIFYSNGTSFNPTLVFLSGQGNWSVNNTKFFVSGDVGAPGSDDLFAMYDYGNSNMGIFVFARPPLTLGLDGVANRSITYLQALKLYSSGPDSWNVGATKFLSMGDFDNDLLDEFAAVYNYGNSNMGIWSFDFGGPPSFSTDMRAVPGNILLATLKYSTGPGNWDLSRTKFAVSGDYDGDVISDLALIYDYGNSTMGIWMFKSNGLGFVAQPWFNSGPGNWSTAGTKFTVSGFSDPNTSSDLSLMYDYGNSSMGIWNFSFNNPGI